MGCVVVGWVCGAVVVGGGGRGGGRGWGGSCQQGFEPLIFHELRPTHHSK